MLKNIIGVFVLMMIGIWVVFPGNAMGGEDASHIPRVHDGARPVEDEGPIMSVDRENRNIAIKEMRFVVGRFLVNNELHTTRLFDAKGNRVDLDHFKAGQWVVVRGYRVSKSKIYACSVRAVAGCIQKEGRTMDAIVISPY